MATVEKFLKIDRNGNKICPLNGCADMLSHFVHTVVIPLTILFTSSQAFIYFFGLYCSLQLNFYYWKEYNLLIEYWRRNVHESYWKLNSYWKLRFRIERNNLFSAMNSTITLGSAKNRLPSETVFESNEKLVEPEVNQTEKGQRPAEDNSLDETDVFLPSNPL